MRLVDTLKLFLCITCFMASGLAQSAKWRAMEVTSDIKLVPNTKVESQIDTEKNGEKTDLVGLSSEVAGVLDPGFNVTRDMKHAFGGALERFRPAFAKHGCDFENLQIVTGHRQVEGVGGADKTRTVWVKIVGCLPEPMPTDISVKCNRRWQGRGAYCTEQDMIDILSICADALQTLEPVRASNLNGSNKNHKD